MMNTVPRRIKKKNSSCGKTNLTSARARRRPRGCSTSFSHDITSHWQRRVTCRANLNVAATEIQFEVSFSYSHEPNQSHASWAAVSSFISSVKSHSTRQHHHKIARHFHFVCKIALETSNLSQHSIMTKFGSQGPRKRAERQKKTSFSFLCLFLFSSPFLLLVFPFVFSVFSPFLFMLLGPPSGFPFRLCSFRVPPFSHTSILHGLHRSHLFFPFSPSQRNINPATGTKVTTTATKG